MSAPIRLSVVGSAPLSPPELERFAYLLADGRTPATAYQESQAGVKLACGLQQLMTAETQARVSYLRSQAENAPVMPVQSLKEQARKYTKQAVDTLASVMNDPLQPASARTSAARDLLEFGHGKALAKHEIEVSSFETLSPEARAVFERVCDMLMTQMRAEQAQIIDGKAR